MLSTRRAGNLRGNTCQRRYDSPVPNQYTDYLLRLTTLAVSFVGFAAMVVALRRARGAELGELHMHFVRMFIEGGLAVAALGLIPVLLTFAGLSETRLWRAGSLLAAALFSAYIVTLARRRRHLGDVAPKASWLTIVNFVVSIAAVLALWVNVVYSGDPRPYMFSLTWFLILGGWVFVQNLERFLRDTA